MGVEVVRAALESNLWASLTGAGIGPQQIVADNTYETPPGLPYAVVTVSIDSLATDSLGGDKSELITGSMMATIYTPKQIGAGLGESIGLAVTQGWVALAANKWGGAAVKVVPRNLEGPRTLTPTTKNAHATVVAASFTAQVA